MEFFTQLKIYFKRKFELKINKKLKLDWKLIAK